MGQVLYGYYSIPAGVDTPIDIVMNPEGDKLRSAMRCALSPCTSACIAWQLQSQARGGLLIHHILFVNQDALNVNQGSCKQAIRATAASGVIHVHTLQVVLLQPVLASMTGR